MKKNSLHFRARFGAVRDTLRRLLKARDGVEAIEFAIIFPVLMLFLLGCIEFGRLYWTQSELQFAAEAAARCVTVGCAANITGTGPGTYAANHVYSVPVPAGAVFKLYPAANASATPPVATGPACGNLVTVCFPFQFIAPALFPFKNTAPAACAAGNNPTVPCCPPTYSAPATGLTLNAIGCHQAPIPSS
jgi:hypothetical protein